MTTHWNMHWNEPVASSVSILKTCSSLSPLKVLLGTLHLYMDTFGKKTLTTYLKYTHILSQLITRISNKHFDHQFAFHAFSARPISIKICTFFGQPTVCKRLGSAVRFVSRNTTISQPKSMSTLSARLMASTKSIVRIHSPVHLRIPSQYVECLR